MDFRARDADGGLWLFEVSGAYSTTRPGLRRPDVLWRALGKASVLHEVRQRTGPAATWARSSSSPPMPPQPDTDGAKALRAVLGDDRSGPVHDVLELLDPDVHGAPGRLCGGYPKPPMSPGQDGDRSRAR